MADKNERTYIINLRKAFSKAPNYRRSSKSIKAIKEFVSKHMKSDNVFIGQYLNKEIWKNGRKNPPPKIEVKVKKEDDKVFVELASAPIKEEPKKEEKKKTLKEKVIEKKEEIQKPKEEKKSNKTPTASELKDKK